MANAYATAGTIINRAAVQLGIASVSDPYGQQSQDPNLGMLAEFLTTTGDELLREQDWSHLVKDYSITTVAGQTVYALPSDFHQMIDQTGWNRNTFMPLIGPVTDQQWTYVKNRQANVLFNVIFRIREGELEIMAAVPSGQTITLEYVSDGWVRDAADATVDAAGQPVGNKSAPTQSGDLVLFDPLLVVRSLKLLWLQARGFDTTVAKREYENVLAHSQSVNRGSQVLSLHRRGRMTDRLMDEANLPITGYGL